MPDCKRGCKGCMSTALVELSSTLYLVIGVTLLAASGATFFTPIGEIITAAYAGGMAGGGVAIIVIACIGFYAACDSKQRVGMLWLFTLLTFCVVVLMIAVTAVFFQYEEVLGLASAAGGENGRAEVEGGIGEATEVLSETAASLVSDLAKNAFHACNATGARAPTCCCQLVPPQCPRAVARRRSQSRRRPRHRSTSSPARTPTLPSSPTPSPAAAWRRR